MFIISIDVDVGSERLGIVNQGRNDRIVHNYLSETAIGQAEKTALPIFLEAFEDYDVPVTFGMRGQMIDVDSKSLELVLNSSVKHDIGSHGYSHKMFTNLSRQEAQDEISKLTYAMSFFGITPVSFIFPRNSVAHLDLLENSGYKTFRSYGNFLLDCMQIERCGGLYNLRPSLNLDQSINALLPKLILRLAISKRAPLHLWFHLWNFGLTEKAIKRSVDRVICPLLKLARQQTDVDLLAIETMASAYNKLEQQVCSKRSKAIL